MSKIGQTKNDSFIEDVRKECLVTTAPEESDSPIAPHFPFDVLPSPLAKLAFDLEFTFGYTSEYSVCSMLGVASVAIGRSAAIKMKTGWTETPTLWMALVGNPGSAKSHPLKLLFRPILELDAAANKQYVQELRQYEIDLRQAKKKKGQQPPEPVFLQRVLGDATIEAVVHAHAINPRGIGIYRDELTAWIMDFGRYTKGSDVQTYLMAWGGQPIMLNRRKDKVPILIDSPCIPVIGTMQPGIIPLLGAGDRKHIGFIDRFLFAFPEKVDHREWNEHELDDDQLERWRQVIDRLSSIPTPLPGEESLLLTLDKEAKKLWHDEYGRLQTEIKELNEQGQHARAGYRTKLINYMARLALIIEMLGWATSAKKRPPTTVTADSLRRATLLLAYFQGTGDKVLFRVHEAIASDHLQGNRERLYRNLPEVFTTAFAIDIGKHFGCQAIG